jgi:hypothetical protein
VVLGEIFLHVFLAGINLLIDKVMNFRLLSSLVIDKDLLRLADVYRFGMIWNLS